MKLILGAGILFTAPAHAIDVQRKAQAGVTTTMWTYHSYDDDCKAGPGIVRLVTKPTNGKASTRYINSAIKTDHWGSPHKCAGHTIKALAVFYTPNRGFRGIDRFSIDVKWRVKTDSDRFTVLVE